MDADKVGRAFSWRRFEVAVGDQNRGGSHDDDVTFSLHWSLGAWELSFRSSASDSW